MRGASGAEILTEYKRGQGQSVRAEFFCSVFVRFYGGGNYKSYKKDKKVYKKC